MEEPGDKKPSQPDVLQLPAPTVWPMALALGVALVVAGMVTSWAISLLGLLLALCGGAGWFRQVVPHEQHQAVPVLFEEVPVVRTRALAGRLPPGEIHRRIRPFETFQIVSGIRGGIAGGVAMSVPAVVFSLLKYHSFWYAINLLAAGGFVSWAGASDAFLSEFHLRGLLAAIVIHGLTSVLFGLLYGAMLPMFPRYPIVTAGFVAPLLWTGIIFFALDIVSPILYERVDWTWFVMSQIAFGLVAGFVVNLHAKVRTPQFQALPFAVRAGIHSDVAHLREEEKDPPQ